MKNNSSKRIIPAEELGNASVWKLQALSGTAARARGIDAGDLAHQGVRGQHRTPGAAQVTATALEQSVQDAYARGFAAGQAEAEASLRAEFAARERLLAPIVESTRHAAAALDERISQHVLAFALAVASHVVRAELSIEPRHFIDLVREGLGMIGDGVARIAIHVNPADASLVREDLGDFDPRIVVVEDAGISSGGCRFVSAHGEIDATLEKRLQAVALPLGVPAAEPARAARTRAQASSLAEA